MHLGVISSLWGYIEFMGIYRVYWDISSYHLHILHCKIMTVSYVTHLIFHGNFAQTITNVRKVETNVRKVEIYESELVPNCGQFTHFFHFDTTEKIIRVRRKLLTRDKSPSP